VIEAHWNPFANAMIGFAIRRALRRNFRAVLVAGEENLRDVDAARSIVVCANHTNWWDGFLAQYLTEKLLPGRRSHLAQSNDQLQKYSYFRWAGAFGVDAEARKIGGLRHALHLLKDHRVAVWMFPQGRIHHPNTGLLARDGAAFLARKSGAQIVPICFRYEWLVESRPSILVRIGGSLASGARTDELTTVMQTLHAQTEDRLDPLDLGEFRPIMKPRMSLNKRVEWVCAALRGNLREFERENNQ
jgi:1-acyl-sn-glycerol-3-phosphate acyltransferase